MLFLLPLLACFLAARGAPTGLGAQERRDAAGKGKGDSCSFWMETIQNQGVAAFNPTANYTVFRNVKDYGAKGDGITDDTASIQLAISSGNRVGPSSGQTSTTTQAVVYFPNGTYLITQPIVDYYVTQLIGNPNCLPIIKASSTFAAPKGHRNTLINGIDNGVGLFTPTNVFWRQIRNFIIDTTAVHSNVTISGISWPTGQATSLQNIVFKLANTLGTQHIGVAIPGGSGGWMTDLVFNGGLYGMSSGNQQFSMRNLTFHGCVTAILQSFDWGWTYKNLNIYNCTTGIDATTGGSSAENVDSIVVYDSYIQDTSVAFATSHSPTSQPPGAGSLILENVILKNVKVAVTGNGGVKTLAGTKKTKTIAGYAQGHEYLPSGPTNPIGTISPNPRPSALLGGPHNGYFEMSKPQYQNLAPSAFLSVRTAGAKGDGVTDDSVAIQNALSQAVSTGKVLYFDAGTYLVTTTILFPPGSMIVGEAYPVIMSSGSYFNDVNNPVPVVQVGSVGSTGQLQWSDMIVSTSGPQAGAILIQWNLNNGAGGSGGTPNGMWDVHTRIGGFKGSQQQSNVCPTDPGTVYTASNIRTNCLAAFMSMQMQAVSGGVYMENNWFWTADHDVDAVSTDVAPYSRITVYTGRGLLVESTAGQIFMYGSAVEHHSKYQYQFVNTTNIILGAIQTETPYYQPNPGANLPYPANSAYGDPVFPTTAFTDGNLTIPNADAWGLRVVNTNPLLIYGAGLYSFFNNYSTTCSNAGQQSVCQSRIFSVDSSSNVYLYDLHTVGAHEMITVNDDVDIAKATDNEGQNSFIQEIAVFRSDS